MTAKSAYSTDPLLRPFLSPTFDAADYLNTSLPPLSILPVGTSTSASPSLIQLSAETQSVLTTLSAQTTRLTNTLTSLTDDILRIGSKLAYQVDVLRGESFVLADVLDGKVADQMAIFTAKPDGLEEAGSDSGMAVTAPETAEQAPGFQAKLTSNEPDYVSQLRLLSHVRMRLDAVIKVFGAAIDWSCPSSGSSSSSTSFISVSAPTAGEQDRKAKAYLEELRAELVAQVSSGEEQEAFLKVQQLRRLLPVWKGTAEEKLREELVLGLDRFLQEVIEESHDTREDKHNQLDDQHVYLTGMYT